MDRETAKEVVKSILFLVFFFVAMVWCFQAFAAVESAPSASNLTALIPGEQKLTPANPDDIMLGAFTLPIALTALLAVFFTVVPGVPGRFKPLVAIGFGIGLALLGITYAQDGWTAANIINKCMAGFMSGAAATGLHQLASRTIGNQT